MRVGLTGGIGAGKSAVAARLAALGATVIDADALAREVVEPGTPGFAATVAAFGPQVLDGAGRLDRPALASLVFADPAALARLNAIVHPLVGRRAAELAGAAPPGAVVVHDVPLLVENELTSAYDLVLVVQADPDLRVQRLVRDRGMTEPEARARMSAQASDEQRRRAADLVIDNSGSLESLHAQVDRLWRERLAPG